MDEENKKEGMSVKEIESYAKRHRFEIFFSLLFILASLFTLIFWGTTLSVFMTAIGGILSIFFHEKISHFAIKARNALLSKDVTVQLIVAIAALLVAIFLAPVVFFFIGLHAGKSMITFAKEQNH